MQVSDWPSSDADSLIRGPFVAEDKLEKTLSTHPKDFKEKDEIMQKV